MRMRTILAGCAFASLFIAPCTASARSFENNDFNPATSSTSQGAYAMGLRLQGAAPSSTDWTHFGAARANVVAAYTMLTSPASLELATGARLLPASGPLPGAGVVGLIALLVIAARRDLIG